MSGFDDPMNQVTGDDLFFEYRNQELKVIKEASKSVQQRYNSEFGCDIDWMIVPLIQIIGNRMSFDQRSQIFCDQVRVFDGISPVWDVILMGSAYDYSKSYLGLDDMFLPILDFIRGRFLIMDLKDFWIEVKMKVSTQFNYFGLIVVEYFPEIKLKILICAGDDSTKSEAIDNALDELKTLKKQIIPIKKVLGDDFCNKLIEGEGSIIKPRPITEEIVQKITETMSQELISEQIMDEKEDFLGNKEKIYEYDEIMHNSQEFIEKNKEIKQRNEEIFEKNELQFKSSDNAEVRSEEQIIESQFKSSESAIEVEPKASRIDKYFERFQPKTINYNSQSNFYKEQLNRKQIDQSPFNTTGSSKNNKEVGPREPSESRYGLNYRNLINQNKEDESIPSNQILSALPLKRNPEFPLEIEKKSGNDESYFDKFTPGFTLNDLPDEIKNIRNFIECNKQKYLNYYRMKDQNISWMELLVQYHSNEENGIETFNFYAEQEIIWKVSVFGDFLMDLLSLGELIFLHCLYKIILCAKGDLIEDAQSFFSSNEKEVVKLSVSIKLEKYGLPSISSLLFFQEGNPIQPILKILGFEINTVKNLTIRNASNKALDITKELQRNSIKDLLIFDENQKIIPIKNLMKPTKNAVSIIYVVTRCTIKNFENSHYLYVEGAQDIKFKKIAEVNDHKLALFSAEVKINSSFEIRENSYIPIYWLRRNQNMKANNNFEFIFDIENSYRYKERISTFELLLIFSKGFASGNIDTCFDDFCLKLIDTSSNYLLDKSKEKDILSLLESEVSQKILDFDKSFRILVILSFLKSFSFNQNSSFSFRKLIETMQSMKSDLMILLKSRKTYLPAVQGIVKVLIYQAKHHDEDFNFLRQIKDFLVLEKMLQFLFEEYNTVYDFISDKNIKILIDLISRMTLQSQERLFGLMINLTANTSIVIELILTQKIFYAEPKTKRDLFNKYLGTLKLTNDGLLEFLTKVQSYTSNIPNLYEERDLLNFISRILFLKENINTTETETVINIFKIMDEIQLLNHFNSDEFIEKIIETDMFYKAFYFIKFFGLNLSLWIYSWLKLNKSYFGFATKSKFNLDKIKKIDSEIKKLDEISQNEFAKEFFTMVNEDEFLGLIDHFTKVSSKVFKDIYIESFKKIIGLNTFVRDSVIKKNIMNKNTDTIYEEIYIYAISGCTASEKELCEILILDPSDSHPLFKFLEDPLIHKNHEAYKKITNYLRNIIEGIMKESISFKDFQIFEKHNKLQKLSFMKYINLILQNPLEYDAFQDMFQLLLEKYLNIISNLNILKMIHYKYIRNPRTENSLIAFEEFHYTLWEMSLGDCSLNKKLKNLESEFSINTVLLKSLLFSSYLKDKSIEDFESCIEDQYDPFILKLEIIENLSFTNESLLKLMIFMSKPNETMKETTLLSKIIRNQNFSERLNFILQSFLKFFKINQIVSYVLALAQLLELDDEIVQKDLFFPLNFSDDFLFLIESFNERNLSSFIPEEVDSLITFFMSLSESRNSLILINSLQEDEISFWKECFQENNENKRLTLELIQVFSNTWTFLHIIKGSKGTLFTYFKKIKELLQNPKYRNFLEELSRCEEDLHILEEYHKSLNNLEQEKLNKIKMIVTHSTFNIFMHHSTYEITLKVLKENGECRLHPLDFSELKELRDRALLSKYIMDQKSSSKEIVQDVKVFQIFVDFVECLNRFIETLNQLSHSLYRDRLEIDENFMIEKGEFFRMIEVCEFFRELSEEYQEVHRLAMRESYWMNFLNGERTILIDKFTFNQSEENLQAILPLLSYMNKGIPDLNLMQFDRPNEMVNRFKIIESQLQHFETNSDSLKLYMPGLETKEKPLGHLILLENKEYYRSILSIYAIYEESVPSIDLVFFCYLSTIWQELKMFINRCFLNPENKIYSLVFPENLSLENQTKLETKLLKNFKNNCGKCVAILTTNSRSKLVNNLRYQNLVPIEKVKSYLLLKDQQIRVIIENIGAKIQVVSSERSGLGKSRFIQKKCLEAGGEVKEIDLSGTYESFELGSALEKIFSEKDTNYHIQVSYLSTPEYFEHLIFSLSVFKQHYSEKSLFRLQDNSRIFIEIANTFKNKLSSSLPFLKLLPKQKHLSDFSIQDLVTSDDIAYVSSYLKLYDSGLINDQDLNYHNSDFQSITHQETCQLLTKYFLKTQEKKWNFHQLVTFVKILARLLQNFEKSMFSADIMRIQMKDFHETTWQNLFVNIRSSLMQSMVETTKEFTKCSESVLKGQTAALSKAENSLSEVQDLTENSVKWENSNHFIALFLAEGDFMCIYRKAEMVPENIKKLILSQESIQNALRSGRNPRFDNNLKIQEYSALSSNDLIEKLLSFYIKYSLRKMREETFQKQEIDFETLKYLRLMSMEATGYVLTPDNFLKMNLIYLRCISNLPLIIMGETGCGKTSLLRFFVREVLQESLEIVYIHSGITVEMIRNVLNEANQKALIYPDDRLWVFFDEFNTSDCIGVLTNILCEKKFENMYLSPNLIFVGACNPYRVKKAVAFEENVGIKKKLGEAQLVHLVKPLPEKATEFVWDFGSLQSNEIRKYVESMLKLEKISHQDLFVDLICKVHEYFQSKEDVSSVSLRDAHRFLKLLKWFQISIKEREKYPISKPDKIYLELVDELNDFSHFKDIRGGLLALFHCYYLRISSNVQREEMFGVIMSSLLKRLPHVNRDYIEKLLQLEQLDFIKRMIIPGGVALNQALTENIFAVFPCLMNNIPIFICGKPGCSKSLAIQIIQSSVRGDKSADPYFKTLPELNFVSFQGSDSCTSEGVEEVFKKALKVKTFAKGILPVVLFDEIGLAEVSRYNPLKVLHRLLEAENCEVAFIAISNWRLDASKMNRALYLARPDPLQEDLVRTARTLFESLGVQLEDPRVKDLAHGYFDLKRRHLNSPFPDFYGLRDFYSMIKLVGNRLKKGKGDLDFIVQNALLRNFNGLEKTKFLVEESFCSFFQKFLSRTSVVDLVKENLAEKESRYLMVICAQDVSMYLQATLIKEQLPNARFIMGSTLELDVLQEGTRFRLLSDIIGYMEQGIPIVLHNMDIIYSSLYDLFNQNFIRLGNSRKYCRIALGAQFNPKCFVNKHFKAVVFLDSDDETLKSADAPFLNRFEKHFLVVRDILSERSLEISGKIENWIQNILKIQRNENLLNPVAVFPCYSPETVNLLVKIYEDDPEVEMKCKRFWLKNASMDVLVLNKMNQVEEDEKFSIERLWKSCHVRSFPDYLQKIIESSKQVKMVSATYDPSSVDHLKIDFEEFLQIEKCTNFRSEEELKKNFTSFLLGLRVLYLFELDFKKENQHLRFVVNLFERVSFELKERIEGNRKNVLILIRMARNDENRIPLCLFNGWRYKMFEDLKFSPLEIAEEVLENDTETIVKKENVFCFEEHVGDISQRAVETLKYFSNLFNFQTISEYKVSIEKALTSSTDIIKAFKQKILSQITKFLRRSREKWHESLFASQNIIYHSLSIKDSMKIYVYEKFVNEFTKLLVLCEKKAVLSQIIDLKSNYYCNIWMSLFNNLSTNDMKVQVTPESNQLIYKGILHTPFIYEDILKLISYHEEELSGANIEDSDRVLLMRKYHIENCSWRERSNLFYSDLSLQENFIKDFIHIILIERDHDISDIHEIQYVILLYLSQFETDHRLLKLLDFKDMILSLNKILKNLKQIGCNDPTTYFMENSDVEYLDFNEKWNSFFENLVRSTFPSKVDFKSLASLKYYSQKIVEIKESLQMVDFSSQSLEILEFWIQLAQIDSEELLLEVSKKVEDNGFEVILERAVVEEILLKLTPKTIQTSKFKLFYFITLLKQSSDFFDIIIKEIIQEDLWNYTGPIFDMVLDLTGLETEILNAEQNTLDLLGILTQKNEFLEKLVNLLNADESAFSIILCDKISQIHSEVRYSNYKDICSFYMNLLDDIQSNGKNDRKLMIIIASGRVRYYLTDFSYFLMDEFNGHQADVEDMLQDMKTLLSEKQNLQYELFVMKNLKTLSGETLFSLISKLKGIKYEWKHPIDSITVKNEFQIFPFIQLDNPLYQKLSLGLSELNKNINALDSLISKGVTSHFKLLLGLALINQVYLHYKFLNFESNRYKNWFNKKKKQISSNLGEEYSRLVNLLIFNFPKNSRLFMHPNVDDKGFYKIQAVVTSILLVISHQQTQNPLSSLIFENNSNLCKNICTRINSLYVVGNGVDKMHDYLKYNKENFELLKSTTFNKGYSKGGSYVCSNDCSYFYIVNHCGGTQEKRNCPFCKKKIGGNNYLIVRRKGHRNLTDDEARSYLNEKCELFKNSETTGLHVSDSNLVLSVPREMKYLTSYYFLNLSVHSIFYFCSIADLFPKKQLLELYKISSTNELNARIEKIIEEDLNEIMSTVKGETCYYWTLACILNLNKIIESFNQEPINKEIRLKFEQDFESLVTSADPYLLTNQFKSELNSQLQPSNLIKYIDELEIPPQNNYPFTCYFRETGTSSWETLSHSFLRSPRKLELKTLSLFIENFNEILNLQYFWPIVKLSRALVLEFSFKISRQEALNLKVQDALARYPNLIKDLEDFLIAWNSLSVSLTFDCKSFEKIPLDEDSCLAYFLVDNDINSSGILIAAALRKLAELQNLLKKVLFEEGNQCEKMFLISHLTKQDIFSVDQEFLQSLAENCSIHGFQFGRGKEIFFDFDRVQLNLEGKLADVKMLNTEKIETIQYQYELLNTRSKYSGVIEQIRSSIPQEPLTESDILKIEKNVRALAASLKINDLTVFNEIYSYLNRLLSIILKQDLQIVKTIKQMQLFSMKFCSKFKVENIIWDFPLSKITSLFETIEVKVYPEVLKSIRNDYKLQFKPDVPAQDFIAGFRIIVLKEFGEAAFVEAHKVIRRMACRLLTANLDSEFFICDYFGNENYWSLEFTDKCEEIAKNFPKELRFMNAIQIESIFDRLINPKSDEIGKKISSSTTSRTSNFLKKQIKF